MCTLKGDWPTGYYNTLSNFGVCVEAHGTTFKTGGESLMIVYQAQSQRQWYTDLENGDALTYHP